MANKASNVSVSSETESPQDSVWTSNAYYGIMTVLVLLFALIVLALILIFTYARVKNYTQVINPPQPTPANPSPFDLVVDVNTPVPTNQQNGSFSKPYGSITQAVAAIAADPSPTAIDYTILVLGGDYTTVDAELVIDTNNPLSNQRICISALGQVNLNNIVWNIAASNGI